MYNAFMVNIQVREVPEQVRDTLAEVARSQGKSMQAYLLALLEEDARQARNVMLLRRVREAGGGYVATPGETAKEIGAIRTERDQRNVGAP
jgi:antitoxin FitA